VTKNLKCFLSYAHVDKDFVLGEIAPVLREFGLQVWVDHEQIRIGESIQDAVMKGIREAHFIVAVLNRRSTYVNFEIGAAMGQAKPTLAVLREKDVPSDLLGFSYLRWIDSYDEGFRHNFRHAIEVITHNPIDETIYNAAENERIIGISIGQGNTDIEKQLRFTVDLLALLQEISGSEEIQLVQARKGSFSSFFSLDLRPWAELVEKVIFFIPEWKKKKLENLQIQANLEKTNAEKEQIESTTRINERQAQIEQAGAMLDLLERYKALGVKVQFGQEVLLSVDETGLIKAEKPERLK
jgi:hypothetical protein